VSSNKKNSLNIIAVDQQVSKHQTRASKISRREESQARYDRLWLKDPEQFNSSRTVIEIERLKRTGLLISEYIDLNEKQVADLGCGSGIFSRQLRDSGALVQAIDVSQNALRELQKHDCTNIAPVHDYIPKSLLSDDTFDLVVATELIAHLNESEYRIFFSELARIMKSEGFVLVSTSIDIHSENALQRFADLASTEFDISEWKFSYHYLSIKCLDFFKAPARFVKANKDPNYREKSLEKRFSLGKWWFRINSTKIMSAFWTVVKICSSPIVCFLNSNYTTLIVFEKISKLLWKESAISHAMLIGKRRPIMPPITEEMQPNEIKHKKQVWE